jgi:hypothetical protein
MSTPATWIPLTLQTRKTSRPIKLPDPDKKIFMFVTPNQVKVNINLSLNPAQVKPWLRVIASCFEILK